MNRPFLAAGAVFPLALAAAAAAQPVFVQLTQASRVSGISADGLVVVGELASTSRAMRWTEEGGYQDLGVPSVQALAANADGTVISGLSDTHAFIWTEEGGARYLPVPLGSPGGWGSGISADGRIIAGTFFGGLVQHACLWVDGVFQFIGSSNDDTVTYGISQDGTVVVGRWVTGNSPHAFRWTAGEGMQLIGGGEWSFADAISGDGRVIVGHRRPFPAATYSVPFRWTAEGGREDLTFPATVTTGSANAVSGNGLTIVGRMSNSSVGMYWTRPTGMVDLRARLISLGANVSEPTLGQAVGISADGTAIAGVRYYIRNMPIVTTPPSVVAPVENLVARPDDTVTFYAPVEGTDLNYQWQAADAAAPGGWRNLVSGEESGVITEGADAERMTLSPITVFGPQHERVVRCVVSNSLGSQTTNSASLTLCELGGACRADFDCSGAVQTQDLFDFLTDWTSQAWGGPIIEHLADFNASGTVSSQDLYDYFAAWSAGCG